MPETKICNCGFELWETHNGVKRLKVNYLENHIVDFPLPILSYSPSFDVTVLFALSESDIKSCDFVPTKLTPIDEQAMPMFVDFFKAKGGVMRVEAGWITNINDMLKLPTDIHDIVRMATYKMDYGILIKNIFTGNEPDFIKQRKGL